MYAPGSAPNRNDPTLESLPKVAAYLPEQHLFLSSIDVLDGMQELSAEADLCRGRRQGLHVFREAGSATWGGDSRPHAYRRYWA